MLLNCLLGVCLALLWRWVDDPLLNAIEAIMTKVINLIAVAGLVYGEYLHFTGRLF